VSVTVATRDVERLRAAVARRLGLHFDETKSGFLEEVLRRRLETLDQGCEAYLRQLEADPARELRALARELTVGETYFFRNTNQFLALAGVALPERMRARDGDRALRLLSAGCASGEEAYSLSIAAQEASDPSWKVSVLGVDVNPSALEKAARAKFSRWSLRETAPDVEGRWFRMEGTEAVLDARARTPVHFEERNLIADDPRLWQSGAYDIVFCRNVIMYLTPESAELVIARIARALMPGGYLFLGHAETLRGLSADFHLRHTHETFYYQRREELARSAGPAVPTGSMAPAAAPPALDVDAAGAWVETIRRASERIGVLTAPPVVVGAAGEQSSVGKPRELGTALELMHLERYAEALGGLGAAPLAAVRDPDVLLLRAVLLTHLGQFQDAEAACRRLLDLDELNAGAHYAIALCREGEGDRQGAIDHDQMAVYLDRSFAMPRLHLGLVARKAGDYESARRELGQALLLLQREDPSRILLFGGGFAREALVTLCRAELAACDGQR
jgi:chemotaxis protein methyltransferase CheR